MGDEIRFTPDELKDLVSRGEITDQDLHLMNKADAQVALKFMLAANQGDVLGAPLMPPMGAGRMAAGKPTSVPPAVAPQGVNPAMKTPRYQPRNPTPPPPSGSNIVRKTATESLEEGTDFAGHVGRGRGVKVEGTPSPRPVQRREPESGRISSMKAADESPLAYKDLSDLRSGAKPLKGFGEIKVSRRKPGLDRMPEFPPGSGPRSTPEQFEGAARAWAERVYGGKATDAQITRIRQLLATAMSGKAPK